MVEVNHLHGHILSHFVDLPDRELPHPEYPFLCLLVSGGHTQIVKVDAPEKMEIVGTTIDDAAGEALDKCAKVMGLPYPGGPVIDRLAKEGKTLQEMADYLNEQGFTTSKGYKFTRSAVLVLLKRNNIERITKTNDL